MEILGQGPFTNDVMPAEGKHYVTVFVLARSQEASPQLLEPEKCEGWECVRWNELPDNLFAPLKTLEQQGYEPRDSS